MTQPSITALELRAAAEAVDGRREEQLKVCHLPNELEGKRLQVLDEAEYNRATGEQRNPAVLATAYTRLRNTDHLPQFEITATLELNGKTMVFPAREFDSVFWGEASMEKFLLPYYVSKLTKQDFDKLYEVITSTWIDGNGVKTVTLAMGHTPPTKLMTGNGTLGLAGLEVISLKYDTTGLLMDSLRRESYTDFTSRLQAEGFEVI